MAVTWLGDGATNLRWFIGDENESDRTRNRATVHLMADARRRKNARSFWKLAKQVIVVSMDKWQMHYSSQPVAVASQAGTVAFDEHEDELGSAAVRSVTLHMRHPLRWAAMVGRAVGTWEPYTAQEWLKWGEGGATAQMPPRVVFDVGQDSFVRMVAFALVNQVQLCGAVMDTSMLRKAQDYIVQMQADLEKLIAQHRGKYPVDSGGDALYRALLHWLQTRVRLYGFAQKFEPILAEDVVPLQQYPVEQVMRTRYSSMAQLVKHMHQNYGDDFRRADLLLVNNIGDAAFHLQSVSSAELDWSRIAQANQVGRRWRDLVPVQHALVPTTDLHRQLRMDWPQRFSNDLQWHSLDQNKLIHQVSSALNVPGVDISGREPVHWWGHISAESWLRAYGLIDGTGDSSLRARWIMFLHAPAPYEPLVVTKAVCKSGQSLSMPVVASNKRMFRMLRMYMVLREDDACKYAVYVRRLAYDAAVSNVEVQMKRTAEDDSNQVHLGQWLYYLQPERVQSEVLSLLDDEDVEERDVATEPSEHWGFQVMRLRPGLQGGLNMAPYTAEDFVRVHQKHTVSGLLAPHVGDVHNTLRVDIGGPKEWADVAQLLDRAFKFRNTGDALDIDFLGMLAGSSSSSVDVVGGPLAMDSTNLLSGTRDVQGLWLMTRGRYGAYESLMLPARAAYAHVESSEPVQHYMQHVMMCSNEHDAHMLQAEVEHMCAREYWAARWHSLQGIVRADSRARTMSTLEYGRYVLPLASVVVKSSSSLHKAVLLHHELYGPETMRDEQLSLDQAHVKQHKRSIAKHMERHIKRSFEEAQRVKTGIIAGEHNVRLLLLDLCGVYEPTEFYQSCVEALERVMVTLLAASGAKLHGSSKSGKQHYRYNVLLAVLGLGQEYKNLNKRYSEYRFSSEVCAAFQVQERSVRHLRVFRCSEWPLDVTEKKQKATVDIRTSAEILVLSAVVPATPPTQVSVSSVAEDVATTIVAPETQPTLEPSAKATLTAIASITSNTTKTSAVKRVKKTENVQEQAAKVQARAQVARLRLQSLRDACELRLRSVPRGAAQDGEYMGRMRSELDRIMTLLGSWERLNNEEEQRVLEQLRVVANSQGTVLELAADMADTPSIVSSGQQHPAVVQMLDAATSDAQNASRSDSVEELEAVRTTTLAVTPGAVLATPATNLLTPQRRRSPLFLTPPIYKSPVGDYVSPLAEPLRDTNGQQFVQWFVDAAVGDLSTSLLLWYIALTQDLRSLSDRVKRADNASKQPKGTGNAARIRRQKLDALARKADRMCETLSENQERAAAARAKLRHLTNRDMSFAQLFLREAFDVMNSIMDASDGKVSVPSNDQLQQVTEVVRRQYALMRGIIKNSSKSIGSLVEQRTAVKTFSRLIKSANELLGLQEDGAVSDTTPVVPNYAEHWCLTTYEAAESFAVDDSGRLPMAPMSTAHMCQHSMEGFARMIEEQMKPRAAHYTRRLKVGVGALFITLRGVLMMFVDWAESAEQRQRTANAVAIAQGFPTLCEVQRELTQWLGMQQVQFFLSNNALELNHRLVERQWSWDVQEDEGETLQNELPVLSGVNDEDDEEELGSEDSGDEEDEEQEEEQEEEEPENTPNIKNYAELEKLHRAVWSVETDATSQDDERQIERWKKLIVEALEVRATEEEEWASDGGSDEEDIDSDDSGFLDDDDDAQMDERRIVYEDHVQDEPDQFPMKIGDLNSMQVREDMVQVYAQARKELPDAVYNFMHEAFAPARTTARPNRHVFRLREGFEHLTLPLWREFGAIYLRHRKQHRTLEYNVVRGGQVLGDSRSAGSAVQQMSYDSSRVAPFFIVLVEERGSRAGLLENRPYVQLLRVQNEQLRAEREPLAESEELQWKTQLLVQNITKQVMDDAWVYPPEADTSQQSNDRYREYMNRAEGRLLMDAGDVARSLFSRMIGDEQLQKTLRSALMHASVNLLIAHPLWSALFELVKLHKRGGGADERPVTRVRDVIHMVFDTLPRDAENELEAGALSRFFHYFAAAAIEGQAKRSLPVDFWRLLVNQARLDATFDDIKQRGEGGMDPMQVQQRATASILTALRDAFERSKLDFTEETQNSVQFASVGAIFQAAASSRFGVGGGANLVHRIQKTLQKRVYAMVQQMVKSAAHEFTTLALLSYSCVSHESDGAPQESGVPQTVVQTAKELQAGFPRAFLESVQWGPVEWSPTTGRNAFVRQPDFNTEVRVRAQIKREPFLRNINSQTLLHLIVIVVECVSLAQRSNEEQMHARRLYNVSSAQESWRMESPAWASVCALSCLRTLRWAAYLPLPKSRRDVDDTDSSNSSSSSGYSNDSEDGAKTITTRRHWAHLYDAPRVTVRAGVSKEAEGDDATEPDVLNTIHQLVAYCCNAAERMPLHEAYFEWQNPQKLARDLSTACRAPLGLRLERGEREHEETPYAMALSVFALAFPRHCKMPGTADVPEALGDYITGQSTAVQSAEAFAGTSWYATYQTLVDLYKRVTTSAIAEDTSAIAKGISSSDGQGLFEDESTMGPRTYLRNYNDMPRPRDGALYVNYRTGQAIEYVPLRVDSTKLRRPPREYEQPVTDLQKYMGYASDVSSPMVVQAQEPVVAKPTAVLQPRSKRPAPSTSPEGASKVQRTDETHLSVAPAISSVLAPPLNSMALVDVSVALADHVSMAAASSALHQIEQPVAHIVEHACSAAEAMVQQDSALLQAYNKDPTVASVLVQRAAPGAQAEAAADIVRLVQSADPKTPEKLLESVGRSARVQAAYTALAAQFYSQFIDKIAEDERIAEDVRIELVEALEQLYQQYNQDNVKLFECLVDSACQDMHWPSGLSALKKVQLVAYVRSKLSELKKVLVPDA